MIEEHLTAEQGVSAYDLLRNHTQLDGELLKQAARFGCVWLEPGAKPKRLRRLKQRLKQGDVIHLYLNQALLSAEIPEAKCIADETDYSIWFKPRGMFSQGSKWGDAHSISRFVELALERPAYLVHRLDRMTAGLMIIAHRKKLVQEFTELFTQRAIEKVYYAVCNGQPGASHFTMNEPLDDRPAETTAWLISSDPGRDQALLRLQLKTGRKHQIRRHLAMAGHAIVGDRLYGENASQEDLQLVAASLAFSSPLDGHEVNYELPEEVLSSSLIMSVNKSGC